jgi:glycine cleavage system aminomethyltransferase T
MGYVSSEAADPSAPLEVTVVGDRRQCRILSEPPVDPKGTRMRA